MLQLFLFLHVMGAIAVFAPPVPAATPCFAVAGTTLAFPGESEDPVRPC